MISIEKLDGSTGWFDKAKAEKWSDAERWDGNNMVSIVAGKHAHETLYRTASGAWVLYFTTAWQGTPDSYRQITPDAAAEWLIKCGYKVTREDCGADVAECVAAMEV